MLRMRPSSRHNKLEDLLRSEELPLPSRSTNRDSNQHIILGPAGHRHVARDTAGPTHAPLLRRLDVPPVPLAAARHRRPAAQPPLAHFPRQPPGAAYHSDA
jgi:hypothetical protein